MTKSVLSLLFAWVLLCGFQQRTTPQSGEPNQKQTSATQPRSESSEQKTTPIGPRQSRPESADQNSDRNKESGNQNVHIVAPEKTVDRVERVVSIVGMICTIVLAIVGIAGICFGWQSLRAIQRQGVIMIRQSRILQRQANTAERQTDLLQHEFVAVHRPRISVRNFYFHKLKGVGGIPDLPIGIQNGSLFTGQYYVVNIGGSIAQVVEIDCSVWDEEEDGPLPMRRPYEGRVGTPMNVDLHPGQSIIGIFSKRTPFSGNAMARAIGRLKIFVVGKVVYKDEVGIRRQVGFCRMYDPTRDRFVPIEDIDYEYSD